MRASSGLSLATNVPPNCKFINIIMIIITIVASTTHPTYDKYQSSQCPIHESKIDTGDVWHLGSSFVVAPCRIDLLPMFGRTDSHAPREACEGQDKDLASCTVADSIHLVIDEYQDYTLLASPGLASDDTRLASSTYDAYYSLANDSFHSQCVS
jgi:hypothetical protein